MNAMVTLSASMVVRTRKALTDATVQKDTHDTSSTTSVLVSHFFVGLVGAFLIYGLKVAM